MATIMIAVHHSYLDVSNGLKMAPSNTSQAVKTTIAAAGGGGARELTCLKLFGTYFFCCIFFYYTNDISYDYDYQQLHLDKTGTSMCQDSHPQHKKKAQMTVHTVVWALICPSRVPHHNGHKPLSTTNGGSRHVLSPHVCKGTSRYWGDEGKGLRRLCVSSPWSVFLDRYIFIYVFCRIS